MSMPVYKICVLFFTLLFPIISIADNIYTIVGNGIAGFKDHLNSVSAQLYYPSGVSVSENGDIYIADSMNNRIRKVKKNKDDDLYRKSTIYTIAGNNKYGYDSTGVKADTASLAVPKDVFAVNKGDYDEVYFSDSKNNIIRMIDKRGFIRRIAGNRKFGYSGDNGPACKAMLGEPNGIFVDKNENVYIADTFNHRVRVVYRKGKVAGLNEKKLVKGYIYTIAGCGEPGSSGDEGKAGKAYIGEPYDVCTDIAGNVYIAQKHGSIVRKININTGVITTAAGIPNQAGYSGDDHPANKEKLNQPFGVAVDKENNLYIADGNNNRIRKVDPKGIIHTICGNGKVGYAGDGAPAVNALLSYPLNICIDNKGNLFITDSVNSVIRMITDK